MFSIATAICTETSWKNERLGTSGEDRQEVGIHRVRLLERKQHVERVYKQVCRQAHQEKMGKRLVYIELNYQRENSMQKAFTRRFVGRSHWIRQIDITYFGIQIKFIQMQIPSIDLVFQQIKLNIIHLRWFNLYLLYITFFRVVQYKFQCHVAYTLYTIKHRQSLCYIT